MTTHITTLKQAEDILRANQVVQLSPSKAEYVEGKVLLDTCGLRYTKKNWGSVVQRQIDKHCLVELVDFQIGFSNPTSVWENSKGGRPSKEYRFSLNAANHILLAAMTKEGKVARQQAIDLAVATQEQLVDYSSAYLGIARYMAGLESNKPQWKMLIEDIRTNGVIKAVTSFIGSTGGKACNQLKKEDRAALLLKAEQVVKEAQKDYRFHGKNFNTRDYEAFTEAALLLADRRGSVQARRITELNK